MQFNIVTNKRESCSLPAKLQIIINVSEASLRCILSGAWFVLSSNWCLISDRGAVLGAGGNVGNISKVCQHYYYSGMFCPQQSLCLAFIIIIITFISFISLPEYEIYLDTDKRKCQLQDIIIIQLWRQVHWKESFQLTLSVGWSWVDELENI